jgi:hypothetical protein
MATRTGGMLVKIGITVLIAVAALLMFGPLFAVVTGDEYRGSASLDLGRGDRVTILTTVPDPSQAPKCTATGPGGATMVPSTNEDVFDINGVRYYPTVEFTAGGDGRFQVECANGALFKTDVTTAGFSFGNLLKNGIPTPVILGVVAVAIALILFLRRGRGKRRDSVARQGGAEPDAGAQDDAAGQNLSEPSA